MESLLNSFRTCAPSMNRPLTRPPATLSPSDGEREGVRGISPPAARKTCSAKFPVDFIYYLGSITGVNHIDMSKPKIHRLGDLQLKIMKVLWERSEGTVADVHASLANQTDLAYTTIATMLRKMEVRGLVKHRNEGRSFVYSPAVAAAAVSRS